MGEMKGRTRVRGVAVIQRRLRVGEAGAGAEMRLSRCAPAGPKPLTAPYGAAHPQDRRSSALGRELAADIRHNNTEGKEAMSMKHLSRTLGLAVAVVAALGAVLSASAFASPEFHNGSGVLGSGVKVGFTGSGSEGTLTGGGKKIECAGNTSVGETNGPVKVAKIVVTYNGCKEGSSQCTSGGSAGPEEIITESLKGELVYLKSGKKLPAGELLEPENANKHFVTVNCGSAIEIKESIIGEIPAASTNKLAFTGELSFALNAGKTAQLWKKVEEAGSEHELKAFFGLVKSQLESTETVTFNEELEVKG